MSSSDSSLWTPPDSTFSEFYLDPQDIILSPDDATYLYEKYPRLPRRPDEGCPTCGGEKSFLWKDQVWECPCPVQLQLHKLYLLANIGELYQRLDWEDYEGPATARDVVSIYLNNHEAMTRTGVGLIYHGPFGVGKTMLVSLAAKEFVKMGYRVFFCTFTEMIDMFTKGWGSNSDRTRFEKAIVGSDVFILDDVGKEFKTKNNLAESTFDHVLRQRAVHGRSTLLTTNMTEAELSSGYGQAILSLLSERSILHRSEGEDFRTAARERTLKEIRTSQIRPIF